MGWFSRFTNLLRSNRVSEDIDREMSFHINELADDLILRGMEPAAARREARRRFGNPSVQKERTRDADVMTWLESIAADVRYAVRALRASPVFAIVTVASLGLGIGANTAIFSLINAVVLRTLPVHAPDELLQVTMGGDETGDNAVFTNPIWEQIRDGQDVFSGAFAYGDHGYNLNNGGEVRRATANWVSGEFFSTLGVRPAIGRLVTRTDDVPGCPPIAVLGHGFWQSEYGGSSDIVGRSISLDRKPHVIVGVAQEGFFGVKVGESAQIYTPLCLRSNLQARSNWFLYIIGRRKPDVTDAQISARLATMAPSVYQAALPQDWGAAEKAEFLQYKLGAVPAAHGLSEVRRQYHRALSVLMVVVGLVLLIACANVANLLLARATVRGREMAIRLAIGAARRRVVRQLLTESVLLAGLGAIAGLLFARWGSALLIGVLSTGRSRVMLDLTLDGRVLGFTLAIAVATGVLFGLAPAWRASQIDPQVALKSNARGVVEGHSRFTIGKVLVVGQIALSLVLVVAAGLLLGSFRKLTTLDPGFDRNGVLVAAVNLRNAGYSAAEYSAVHGDLLARFRAIPGVKYVGSSDITPISGNAWNNMIKVDGYNPKDERDGLVYFNEVSDGFFAAMGTPLLAGRDFDQRDRPSGQPVAIVNEAVVQKFFHGGSPLGKQYRIVMHGAAEAPVEIVGVVKNAKYKQIRETAIPTIYVAKAQNAKPGAFANYQLRTAGDPAAVIPAVKAVAAELNRSIALELTPLSRQVDASLTRERLLATLSGFFGALALLLATVGLYGTLSYSVARRRNEIGIRVALGAAQGSVVRLVLGEVARVIVLGVALGALAALASTRWMEAFLYELTPSDPGVLVGSGLLLAAIGLVAGVIPALRASRVDPITALRED